MPDVLTGRGLCTCG